MVVLPVDAYVELQAAVGGAHAGGIHDDGNAVAPQPQNCLTEHPPDVK